MPALCAWSLANLLPPLRFSYAEVDERIKQAVSFLPKAFDRPERVGRFLQDNPQFALRSPYEREI